MDFIYKFQIDYYVSPFTFRSDFLLLFYFWLQHIEHLQLLAAYIFKRQLKFKLYINECIVKYFNHMYNKMNLVNEKCEIIYFSEGINNEIPICCSLGCSISRMNFYII